MLLPICSYAPSRTQDWTYQESIWNAFAGKKGWKWNICTMIECDSFLLWPFLFKDQNLIIGKRPNFVVVHRRLVDNPVYVPSLNQTLFRLRRKKFSQWHA
jgi:hypothetical protein